MKICDQCGVRYTPDDVFCAVDGARLVESNDDFLGHTVGSYRVVRLLGEGGMGRVYLGLHPRIGSRVAIKLLSPIASTDDSLVQRFFAEAQLVNKVRHEGIVNVLDLDHLEDGRPFIIMEYLDGEPLSSLIARGPMSLGIATTIGVEILEALQAAHDCGVVHRDLKPDNIFISPKGRVKLLDFGIAKLMPEFETKAVGPSTRTGSLLGTPGYMAPEQVVGAEVSGATDLYAVGAVLYEALTGTMAFGGTTLFELLRRIVSETPAPPVQRRPELAGPYQALLLRALAKKPEERHSSARAMALELETIRKNLSPEQLVALPAPAWAGDDMGMDKTLLPESAKPLALGSEATMLADQEPRLALGSEATMLADEKPRLALGSEATMLADEGPRLALGSEATMLADQGQRLALESEATVHPPLGGPVPRSTLRGSPPESQIPSYHHTPSEPASTKLWIVGLAALVIGGVAVFAVLSGQESTQEHSSETKVAKATLDAGAPSRPSPPAPARGEASSEPTVGGGADAGRPAPRSPATTKKKAPVSRPSGRAGRREAKPSGSGTPAAASSPPAPLVAEEKAPGPNRSGVTMIETEHLHADSKIHKKPDFNVRAFDAVAYLPKARKLAKKIYPDAVLVEFDARGVGSNGLVNFSFGRFEVTYNFLSRSHAQRKLPIGSEEEMPCRVYVEVDKRGVTARIVDSEECTERSYANPKCSMRQVWTKSDALGMPPGKEKAVSTITYMEGSWFFNIGPLNVSGSLDDKC